MASAVTAGRGTGGAAFKDCGHDSLLVAGVGALLVSLLPVSLSLHRRAACVGGTALVAFMLGHEIELDAAVLVHAGADGAFDDGCGQPAAAGPAGRGAGPWPGRSTAAA